ncbi:uncharacterized protein LOC117135051 [Drosophila busckii]|uniref:uncharacterized protein LOC117135051 n=1 Tax=Drosophila busckii TaxID=30019 RepID=UPI001432CADE|nr:uncharacterized protein LOC117135051 [Drosophila busckii]
MRFASSVGCDDSRSLSAESPEQLYDDDFNESPECGDFGCDEAFEPKPKLQPCLQPLQQQHLQHPCFSEDCEDEDDMDYEATNQQDTNLCPHFTAPEETGPANLRRSSHTPTRYRKPMKNYVEPILYEGNFGKPRQRQERPAQRDYFVSNKQIMPRPRPKYRERVPPSIYVNNIVRGLKCNDEIGGEQPARLNAPAKRYRVGKDGRRYWLVRRPAGGRAAGDGGYMQPHMPRPRPRARQQAHYSENSGEDVSDSMEQDNEQYFDDGSALPWLRQQQTAQLDPCQVEQEQLDRQLERQRVREGARAIASAERLSERERLRDRDNESLVDYAPAHFFT